MRFSITHLRRGRQLVKTSTIGSSAFERPQPVGATSRLRAAIPWVCLLLALSVALIGLDATAPVACNETPRTFTRGVTTDQSTTLGVVASRCAVTDRSTGVTVQKTVVNWSGLIASIAGCIAAWLLGAAIAGLMDRRRAFTWAAVFASAALGALVVLFV